MTFLILDYCFTGERVGAYLHNGKAEVKQPDGKIDRLVFEELTWRVRENLHARCDADRPSKRLAMS